MTWAPLSAAQMMPLAIQLYWPLPLSPRTFPFMRLELKPTPAMPFPLSVIAAAMPAQWVPCPYLSSTVRLVVKFLLATIFAFRSSWS